MHRAASVGTDGVVLTSRTGVRIFLVSLVLPFFPALGAFVFEKCHGCSPYEELDQEGGAVIGSYEARVDAKWRYVVQ
jgi:hypothetical protein